MSPKSRRVVIELCLTILREAIEHAPEEDAGLQLALRCLQAVGVDKLLLTAFWEALRGEVDIGRRHGVERAYEAVRRAVQVEPPNPLEGRGQLS